MYTIRKLFRFEMAHQLSKAYSTACSEQIHGHSYVCEVFFSSFRDHTGEEKLDETGMVIDFGEVKAIIKDYIDSWDHSLVMPDDMPAEYLECLKKYNKNLKIVNYNPTAENMAKDMYETIKKVIPYTSKVRLHETVTGWAEYSE